jgi:cysteinyl-tRNA synthetase
VTIARAPERILATLDKDLNTPQALAVLADLGKAANEVVIATNKAKKDKKTEMAGRKLARAARSALAKACEPLGLMQATSAEFFERTRTRRLSLRGLDPASVEDKLDARRAARAAKDFARADAIRGELTAMGVEVLDSAEGVRWKVMI